MGTQVDPGSLQRVDHSTFPPMKSLTLDGVTVELLPPEPTLPDWIGQNEPLRQLLACWMDGDETDPPLSPRITGVPGVGRLATGS